LLESNTTSRLASCSKSFSVPIHFQELEEIPICKHQLLLAARATSLAQELEHSERTRERELRDSSERLAQVIDTLPMMISATAPDGRIVFANAAFNQFLGCDAEAVVGRNVATVLEAERAARRGGPFRPASAAGASQSAAGQHATTQRSHAWH
jgi:PAS domain-containing protein